MPQIRTSLTHSRPVDRLCTFPEEGKYIFKPLGTKKGLFHMLNINVLPWVLKGTLEDSNVINCKQFLDHRSNDVFKPLPSPCSLTSGIDLGTEHRLWWNVQYLSWLS